VLDLCAAPGGKTAQLAHAGAEVTALDRSEPRLRRLRDNLTRLKLAADIVVADALAYETAPFDAVLLDAPCSATGTIRRHPDVAWSRTLEDVLKLADLQRRLLDSAAALVKPGGVLVYATCSLEPDEGERQVEAFLGRNTAFRLAPIVPADVGGLAEVVTEAGLLRCLPCHLAHSVERMAGMDGFFAARLVRFPV
jgi:16S rRNA (cytosine967-C5)-methyltransferase